MSSVATQSSGRTWTFPAKMTSDLVVFTALIWLGFVVIVSGLVIAIDHWGNLGDSIWEQARQLAQWFLLFMGVHIGSELLPQHITHGKTRRAFFIESGITVSILSAVIAILMTLGWVIERMLFSVLDVEQTIRNTSMFDSPRDYSMIFTESFIILAVWTLGGLYIAASWYRNADTGLIAIAPALLVGMIVDLGMGSRLGPIGGIARHFFDPEQPPLLLTLGVAAIGIALLGWLAWYVIREIPIRNVST